MKATAKIMIVEDEKITAKEIKRSLEHLDYAVTSIASSGEDAVKEAERNRPDLILMDIKLKGKMDGVEAAHRIRARADIPVIYITALSDKNTFKRTKVTEPFGYVHKPVEEKELTTAIAMALFRHKMDRKLKENEERYRDLVEKAGIAILIDDKNGNFKYFNKRFLEMFGYTAKEMKKLSIQEIVHPEDFQRVIRFHEGRIEGKKVPSRIEFRGEKKDGTIIYIEVDSVGFKKGDEIVGTRSYLWDITGRKQAEVKLRESEEKFRNIFENASDGMIYLDTRGRIVDVNQRTVRMFESTRKELLGKHFSKVGVFPSGILPLILKGFKIALKRKKYHLDNLIVKNKEGKEIYLESSSTPLKKENKIVGLLVVSRDVTERKRAEEDREELQEQLIHSEKMAGIGTLTSGIAHEFNNLLQIIKGHTEYAKKTRKSQDIQEAFDVVISNTERARRIVRDLQAFAKREVSKKERVDVIDLIESVLALTSEQLKKHNIKVEKKYTSIPPIKVNRGEMEQVFLHMVINARDAMLPEGGKLKIKVRQSKQYAEISFSDNGKGIEKDNLGKIFEPFHTTKGPVGKSEIPGIGLGLSVSYGIVKRHEGMIDVKSQVGRGTTFTIRLSLEKDKQKARKKEGEKKTKTETFQPMNILVVDDEEEICSMLSKWLSLEGHIVEYSLTGKNAVNLAKKKNFNLVFLDVVMPGIPALDVLDKIKEVSPSSDVIIMTGKLTDEDLFNRLKQKGASGFLQKPFEFDDILKIVMTLK